MEQINGNESFEVGRAGVQIKNHAHTHHDKNHYYHKHGIGKRNATTQNTSFKTASERIPMGKLLPSGHNPKGPAHCLSGCTIHGCAYLGGCVDTVGVVDPVRLGNESKGIIKDDIMLGR